MLNLISLSTTYVFTVIVLGIGYSVMIGAAPAITYVSFKLNDRSIDKDNALLVIGISTALWMLGYFSIVLTGDLAGIFMLVFFILMLVSLSKSFLFTIVCMGLCALIGEAFFSHLWNV